MSNYTQAREHWWQIWRKKHELPDRQITYLAFIAGWNSCVYLKEVLSNENQRPKTRLKEFSEKTARKG